MPRHRKRKKEPGAITFRMLEEVFLRAPVVMPRHNAPIRFLTWGEALRREEEEQREQALLSRLRLLTP